MPRAWLVAQLVLLLSGSCELDAWDGAFVHLTSQLLPRAHQHGLARNQAAHSRFGACGLRPQGVVMQHAAGSGEKRRPTGLGHENRATMSQDAVLARRADQLAQASGQRLEDTLEQRRAEFMAQRFREAEQVNAQRRKNKAAELLKDAMQQQPLGRVEASASRTNAPVSDERSQRQDVALGSAVKTSIKKAPVKKATAKAVPKAAAVMFHDITVESVPASASAVGSHDSRSTVGTAMVKRVMVVDPRDAWTSNKPMPRLKRPEELEELVRIINLALRDVPGYTVAPYSPGEIAVQKIRLTGRRWYMFLEAEDLLDVGKDPARFPAHVRERYVTEIALEGIELVSDEEAHRQLVNHMDSREQRDIARSIKYVEKVAGDYALLFGAAALEDALHSVTFTKEQEIAAKQDPWVLKAVSTIRILQAYSDTSREACDVLGKLFCVASTARGLYALCCWSCAYLCVCVCVCLCVCVFVQSGEGHMLSEDWQREQNTFHEFENKRATLLAQFRAHLRAKANGEVQAVATINLEEGDFVDVEIKSKGPLGYVVKIDYKYDGLVYHNDIFENPPSVGDKTDGWVLKVLYFQAHAHNSELAVGPTSGLYIFLCQYVLYTQ